MKTLLARDNGELAVLCEFRTKAGFLEQCQQADEMGTVIVQLDPGVTHTRLTRRTLCDLCLRLEAAVWERWFHARVLAGSDGHLVLEVYGEPHQDIRERWSEVFKRATATPEVRYERVTSKVIHASLDFRAVKHQSRTLILANLSNRALDRNVRIIDHLQALLARTPEPLPLNTQVDVCLQGEESLRCWYEGRVVNVTPVGAAVQIFTANKDLMEERWSFVWQRRASDMVPASELQDRDPETFYNLVAPHIQTFAPDGVTSTCISTDQPLEKLAQGIFQWTSFSQNKPLAAQLIETATAHEMTLVEWRGDGKKHRILLQRGVALGAESQPAFGPDLASYLVEAGHMTEESRHQAESWMQASPNRTFTQALDKLRLLRHRAALELARNQVTAVVCSMLTTTTPKVRSGVLNTGVHLGLSTPRLNIARAIFQLYRKGLLAALPHQLHKLVGAHAQARPERDTTLRVDMERLGLTQVELGFLALLDGHLSVEDALGLERLPWAHAAALIFSLEQLGFVILSP